jgi:hypothetical protein
MHVVDRLVSADAHLMSVDANVGGDCYTRKDRICMRLLLTSANVYYESTFATYV